MILGGADMSNKAMTVAKCIGCGMAIGGAMGMTLAVSVKQPKMKTIRQKTASAIDTVAAVMRSVADFVD